jgi:hypothetical protein
MVVRSGNTAQGTGFFLFRADIVSDNAGLNITSGVPGVNIKA